MLSILIPIFNYDVSRLVSDLKKQADAFEKPYEIICFDDCSKEEIKKLNRPLSDLSNVKLKELTEKSGRAKIRNQLAAEASFKYLLFLDCDLQIDKPDFIQHYINKASKGTVVCGGIAYADEKPQDSTFLRWHYGIKRESISAKERNLHPYKSFLSSNFLIDKETFQEIRFNEKISGYGHEDTLFGFELKIREIPVLHIDNAVVHIGLDDAPTFLAKSEQALKNLHALYVQHIPGLNEEVKILKWHKKLKSMGLEKLISFFFSILKGAILQNLYAQNPSLKLFDFYKLGYFIQLTQHQKSQQ